MSKNTFKIDGAKVKEALELTTGKTVYQIAKENGFSDNFLKQACKANRASPIVQSVMRSYGLDPEDFKLKEEPELKQMSIEDIDPNLVPREKLDEAIEQSAMVIDNLNSAACNCAYELTEAFSKLKEEWKKALDMYYENIRRLREGK